MALFMGEGLKLDDDGDVVYPHSPDFAPIAAQVDMSAPTLLPHWLLPHYSHNTFTIFLHFSHTLP